MPLYDMDCEKCDTTREVFVPLKQFEEQIKCPVCGEALQRKISAPYFKVH